MPVVPEPRPDRRTADKRKAVMTRDMRSDDMERRGVLECMTWAGTAMVWTMAGGVPRARLIGSAEAATTNFTFVQVSDSHLGFDKPANPERPAPSARR